MSDAEDRELQDQARALLGAAKDPPAASADVRARVLRRLTLAIPIGGGGTPGAPPAPTGAPRTASGLGRALATRVPAWSLLVSFVAGGAIAIAAHSSAPNQEKESAHHEDTVAATSPTAVSSTVTTLPLASTAITTLPTAAPSASPTAAARATASVASRSSGDGTLEAERALLDVARTALGRGDGANALRAADEHARKFPRGILAEEREAMSIQALRLLHRDDEAQARLERFRTSFPSSLIRPALEAADSGSP